MASDILDGLLRLNLGGSVVLLALLCLRRPLQRWFGVQVTYLAWVCVPLAILAMLLPPPLAPVAAPTPATGAALLAPVAAMAAPAADPAPWLLALWLVGVLVVALGFISQQRRYRRSLGRLVARAGTRVLQSEFAFVGPALVGAWRPRIVLPAGFEQRYDAREQALILAHEAIHHRRGDAWINAGVAALQSLNWFNPLLHYAAGRFRLDQELACDALVMARFPHARRHYADAMLKVQLAGQPRQEPGLPVGCRWLSDQTLKERILMLKHARPGTRTRAAGFSFVVALSLMVAYSAWASQAPRTPPSASAGAEFIDATLRVDLAGVAGKSLRVIHPIGSTFEIADGAWQGEFVADALAPDRIALRGTIRENGRVVASPEVHARPGEPFAIAIDGAGTPAFRLEGSLAFADAAASDRPTSAGALQAPPAPPVLPAPPAATPAAPAVAPPPAPPAPPVPPAPPAPPPAPPAVAPPPPPGVPAPPASPIEPSYRALKAVAYPSAAIKSHSEGTVFVKARIGNDGSVLDADVDHTLPAALDPALVDAALQAVKAWTFNPARANGVAIEGEAMVPIQFALPDGAEQGNAPAPPGALDTLTARGNPGH